MRLPISLLLTLLAAAASLFPQTAPAADSRPYVVLLSLDGFRYDYPERYHAANLLQMAKEGVRAQALIPSYRSSTFPNHYSIVTGLYPEHHGIVDNTFYDPKRDVTYVNTAAATGGDGSFYGGTPLWVLAEKQGVHAAAYFYPASETEIQGVRLTRAYKYDATVPNAKRVDEVLSWLRLPEAERPHLILMYFSDLDDTGHKYGPESEEVNAAVARVDQEVGHLRAGLSATGLPVNLFIVADHGMLATNPILSLGKAADFAGFHTAPAAGSQVMLYSPDKALVERTYQRLHNKDKRYRVFHRAQTPAHLHYRDSDRIGDLVIMSTTPAPIGIEQPGRTLTTDKGAHGFDPKRFPQMRGIFFAQGPQLKTGLTLKPFENVNIYPLIAQILGLKITGPIDGIPSVLRRALRN